MSDCWVRRAASRSRSRLSSPRLEFVVLLLQLAAHRTQAQLRIDPRPQHGVVDRLCHEIVRAGFEAQHFAFLAAVTRQHDRRDLRDQRVSVLTQLFKHFRAVHSRHVVVQEQQGRRIRAAAASALRSRPVLRCSRNPARVRMRVSNLRLVASSSATRIRSPEFFAMFFL